MAKTIGTDELWNELQDLAPPNVERARLVLPGVETVPLLFNWLLRARGYILAPTGLTEWGTSAVKVVLCAMLRLAKDGGGASFPPDCIVWLENVLAPSVTEHELAQTLANLLQIVRVRAGEAETDKEILHA